MEKSWDLEVIDQTYEGLIDEFRNQLDSIGLSGLRAQLEALPVFRKYILLLESMEKELLIQWNIKQTRSLESLFAYHKSWLGEELRKKTSLFDYWTDLCVHLWEESAPPNSIFDSSLWRSYVLKSVTEKSTWKSLSMGLQTKQKDIILKKICQILELLYEADPHHQITSFLNLIELGVNDRPVICEIGSVADELVGVSIPKTMQDSVLPAVRGKKWEDLPNKLHQFWQEHGEE